MCGINGIFSTSGVPKIKERIEKMNEAIHHRGPDAQNSFVDNEKVGLGHVRLSIIDVQERSNQPMLTRSKSWGIIFNGEIYNYQELKEELTYDFITDSDTEVILAAVEEKGVDWFLKKANGMFAMALYNLTEKKLFLIRDRMGIKPLYYFMNEEQLIFSSEIKGILSSGLIEASFNEAAVDEYLANRYVRSPYTFFENVFQIPPGTYLSIDEDCNYEMKEYWTIPEDFNVSEDYDEEAIAKKFEEQLVKAIKYRLIADVPLGAYLSGGVDSSLITAVTALHKEEKVNTYTIGFDELNEFNYSKLIAELYNTDHHQIRLKKDDYIGNWEKLIKFKDAPLGVPNEIPLAVMSDKLKEKITVVLSGEGADELMGGYGRIFRAPFDYEHSSEETIGSFYDYFIAKYEYVPRAMRNELINTPKVYREEFDAKISKEFSKNPNNQNVFRFFHKYHVKGLLQRVDMTTMQTSVEARVPFLDHELIEFSYKEVPYELKLKWNNKAAENKARSMDSSMYSEDLDTPKYLLRKVSYNYLPKEIIERKKVGFPVPLTEWFENLESLAQEVLEKAKWLKEGVVNDLIEKSKTEVRAGQILWMFINIELFRRNYFQKNWMW